MFNRPHDGPREEYKAAMHQLTYVFRDLAAETAINLFYRSAAVLPYAVVPRAAARLQGHDGSRSVNSHELLQSWLMSTVNADSRSTSETAGGGEEGLTESCEGGEQKGREVEKLEWEILESLQHDGETKYERMRRWEREERARNKARENAQRQRDHDDEEVLFLLGGEVRRRMKHVKGFGLAPIDVNNIFWSDFGGKREDNETAVITALREFNEETAGLFTDHMDLIKKRMESVESIKVWNGSGFSVLFLVEVPYLPEASATFFALFDEHLECAMHELTEKIEKVIVHKRRVKVAEEPLGTLNKCAVRWVSKTDFMRLFDWMSESRGAFKTHSPVNLTTIEWDSPRVLPPPSPSASSSSPAPPPSGSTSASAGTSLASDPVSSPTPPTLFRMQMYPYFMDYLRHSPFESVIRALPRQLGDHYLPVHRHHLQLRYERSLQHTHGGAGDEHARPNAEKGGKERMKGMGSVMGATVEKNQGKKKKKKNRKRKRREGEKEMEEVERDQGKKKGKKEKAKEQAKMAVHQQERDCTEEHGHGQGHSHEGSQIRGERVCDSSTEEETETEAETDARRSSDRTREYISPEAEASHGSSGRWKREESEGEDQRPHHQHTKIETGKGGKRKLLEFRRQHRERIQKERQKRKHEADERDVVGPKPQKQPENPFLSRKQRETVRALKEAAHQHAHKKRKEKE